LNTQHQHFIIYKPYGYLSQFINNQNTRRNKKLLGELGDFPDNIMAVGRLDEKSEGLLLLTTDGGFSQHIRSHKIEKEYHVQVDGTITTEAIVKLSKGVSISINSKKYQTKPCVVSKIAPPPTRLLNKNSKERSNRHKPTSWLVISLREGKFRQVRKMTASVGFPTLRLIRVRIGELIVDNMSPADVNPLKNAQYNSLINY